MWLEKENSLHRPFIFKDFAEAFAFMTEVAFHAEKQNHHPNWSNVWNTVTIKLTTHDAGNTITEKDYRLAKTIDAVYAKFGYPLKVGQKSVVKPSCDSHPKKKKA